MALDIERYLVSLRQIPEFGKTLASALDLVQSAVNNTGTNTATDPMGELPPPPPIQAVNIKASGGFVHATIEDNGPIQRGIHYFIEYANNTAFFGAHVKHLGTSRTMEPIQLPAMDDNMNPQVWYFRAFSQYPGGKPGRKISFGGTAPTAVNPGGTLAMTLLKSTGSGTASGSGEQAGEGFGSFVFRKEQGVATQRR